MLYRATTAHGRLLGSRGPKAMDNAAKTTDVTFPLGLGLSTLQPVVRGGVHRQMGINSEVALLG
jgi:hypothetical protein